MSLTRNRVTLPCGNNRAELGPGWTEIWTRDDVSSDVEVLDEVFILDVYGLRGMPTAEWGVEGADGPKLGSTVIDLGANIGTFTLASLQFGAAHVVSVEPDPGNVEMLRRNVGKKADKVTVLPMAVGPLHGTVTLSGSGAQAHTEWKEGGPEVRCVPLDHVIDGIEGPIALLKCDIEGSEYDTILTCPNELLQRCERITMEWHGAEMAPWLGTIPKIGALVEKLLYTHDVSVRGYPWRGGNLTAHRYPT